MRRPDGPALLLGLPLSVAACLWDRDTPADEARGLPEVVAVLTGRFERNPPLFYEMRLGRVDGPSPEPSRGPRRLRRRRGRLRPPRARGRGDLLDGEEAGATGRARRLAARGEGAALPLSREPRHVPRPPMGEARGRSGEDRRGEGGSRRDRQGAGDQPERALRPREIPVAGAGVDHRPAEGRGLRSICPISSVGASTISTARRPIPRRPTMPCGGSPA